MLDNVVLILFMITIILMIGDIIFSILATREAMKHEREIFKKRMEAEAELNKTKKLKNKKENE